jgi:hypothetical protein
VWGSNRKTSRTFNHLAITPFEMKVYREGIQVDSTLAYPHTPPHFVSKNLKNKNVDKKPTFRESIEKKNVAANFFYLNLL